MRTKILFQLGVTKRRIANSFIGAEPVGEEPDPKNMTEEELKRRDDDEDRRKRELRDRKR